MKPFETDPSNRSDEQVEALLRGFFRHELPEELPPLPAIESRSTPEPSGMVPFRLPRVASALVAAAAVVLLATWALWPGAKPAGDPQSVAVNEEQPAEQSDVAPLGDLEYTVVERFEPLERFVYETDTGLVEQRAEMRWTTLMVYEPNSGDRAVWTVPELTIEVVSVE